MLTSNTMFGNKEFIMRLKDKPNLLSCYEPNIVRAMKRTHITRIMRAEHFLLMVSSSRNYLSRILKWQDVYECYGTRLKIKACKVRHLLRDYYGQCWSFRTMESELIWNARDFTGEKYKHDVVLIETTIYDLVQSVRAVVVGAESDMVNGFVSIGAVDYSLPQEIAPELVANALSSDVNLTSSLFQKRPQFSDEQELRMIFNITGRLPHKYLEYEQKNGLLSYALKNKGMIKKVICHPKMPSRRVSMLQKKIKNSGWNIPYVEKSDLYDLPKSVFNIF